MKITNSTWRTGRRSGLLHRTPLWSTMIFGYHHILLNGSSFFLFLRELDTAYRFRRPPRKSPILRHHYVDLTASQPCLVQRTTSPFTHHYRVGDFATPITLDIQCVWHPHHPY